MRPEARWADPVKTNQPLPPDPIDYWFVHFKGVGEATENHLREAYRNGYAAGLKDGRKR